MPNITSTSKIFKITCFAWFSRMSTLGFNIPNKPMELNIPSTSTSVSTDTSSTTRKSFIQKSLFYLTSTSTASTTILTQNPSISNAYDADPDKLRESLYLISRVQEATVQQERLVNRNLSQEELKAKMKLSLRLVDKSYRLLDQINFTSQYISPQSEIVQATEAGLEANEALQSAIDYVNNDLKVGPMTKDRKDYLVDALQTARDQLFVYVGYMPQGKLEEARLRIERENVDNRDEFDGASDAGVYNPVKLPWK